MKWTTLEYHAGSGWRIPDYTSGCSLCEEELERIFPHIDWENRTKVIDVAVSRRRDTGFKTIHTRANSQAFKYGQEDFDYLPLVASRWLIRNGFKNGTIYVRMTAR